MPLKPDEDVLLTIPEINQLSYEDFVARFGGVLEHGELAAATVWSNRPFSDLQAIQQFFYNFIDGLPLSGKEGVLRLYPDLAGRLAKNGRLTTNSNEEHKAAGLHNLTDEQEVLLSQLNQEYKSKFNFPFVICAKLNKVDMIIESLKERLELDRLQEVHNGINEVKKICGIRLQLLVK